MLTKKVYIPIGVCLIILVIGFIALRSDVPVESIKVYKSVEPLPKSEVKVSQVGDTSQGGHFHTDGDPWHAGVHETSGQLPQTQTATQQPSEIAQGETIKAGDHAAGALSLLEDSVLAELEAERLKLKQRQMELNTMLQDHIAAVVGRKLTDADIRSGHVSGTAEGLTQAQVIAELESLRSSSENLLKAQAEWRRKYMKHTGKEYPGTEHWILHDAGDSEKLPKWIQYEVESRGWTIVDP